MDDDARISARHKALEAVLNERQRRLHAAVEAKVLGHGAHSRTPLAARHEQVEQDRAPPVLVHQHELAGRATDQP